MQALACACYRNRRYDDGTGDAAGLLLMTDDGVLIQNAGFNGEDAKILKLTPDIHGGYVNGTHAKADLIDEEGRTCCPTARC